MRVSNAKAVASEIKIEMPNSATRTDEDIARTALIHLEWNYSVPGAVKVQVTDVCVTLKGTTEWQYQKEEAERAVRPLRGVKWVSNENSHRESQCGGRQVENRKRLETQCGNRCQTDYRRDVQR